MAIINQIEKYMRFLLLLFCTSVSADNVERVIFAEAAAECTDKERYYISSVIYNRVNHPAFRFNKRKCKTVNEVVTSKGQFIAFNDERNNNWKLTRNPELMNKAQKSAWFNAKTLSRIIRIKLKMPERVKKEIEPKICFFISKDKSGRVNKRLEKKLVNSKIWSIEKAIETENFVFYKIKDE
jgi:hypothetical protein